jgi:cell division protein FtsB
VKNKSESVDVLRTKLKTATEEKIETQKQIQSLKTGTENLKLTKEKLEKELHSLEQNYKLMIEKLNLEIASYRDKLLVKQNS